MEREEEKRSNSMYVKRKRRLKNWKEDWLNIYLQNFGKIFTEIILFLKNYFFKLLNLEKLQVLVLVLKRQTNSSISFLQQHKSSKITSYSTMTSLGFSCHEFLLFLTTPRLPGLVRQISFLFFIFFFDIGILKELTKHSQKIICIIKKKINPKID